MLVPNVVVHVDADHTIPAHFASASFSKQIKQSSNRAWVRYAWAYLENINLIVDAFYLGRIWLYTEDSIQKQSNTMVPFFMDRKINQEKDF